MNIRKIRTRGHLLTFDDAISIYLITTPRFSLLCDTHLGPESMKMVTGYLADSEIEKPVIIFNSHSDWDHIWGNCSFPESWIIGHEFCNRRIEERGAFDLIQNCESQQGDVVLVSPNMTFSKRLDFEQEKIGFAYAPGHTIDSAVCYDKHDQVLYVGDLVEDPIPYLDDSDLDRYLNTLQKLLDYQADILVCAHSGIVSRDIVLRNIEYIRRVRDGIPQNPESFGDYASVHRWNMNMQVINRDIPRIRKMMGDRFSLPDLLAAAGDLHTRSDDLLQDILSRYPCCDTDTMRRKLEKQ